MLHLILCLLAELAHILFPLADWWGSLSSMSSICSRDQYLTQSTGHSYCAYLCRRGIASWCTAYGNYGHIRPSKDLPIVALTVILIGILSLFCNFAERYFSYSSWAIKIFCYSSTFVCFCFFLVDCSIPSSVNLVYVLFLLVVDLWCVANEVLRPIRWFLVIIIPPRI